MERSNPESVERLRSNGRSVYVSAAHAASFALRVSARTFAEAIRFSSRDIALPSAGAVANRATKNPGGGANQGSDEHEERPRLSFNERRYASMQYDSYAFVFMRGR